MAKKNEIIMASRVDEKIKCLQMLDMAFNITEGTEKFAFYMAALDLVTSMSYTERIEALMKLV